MKRIALTALVFLLLCGCSSVKERREDQEQLERLQIQLENGSLTISDTLPFSYALTITEEEPYEYTLTIDQFEIAMHDVKIVAKTDTVDDEVISLGFDDDQTYQVIPFQEDSEKNYYSSISINGTLTSLQDQLEVIIQWKDVSGVNTYQRFWIIDCSLYA